MTLFPVWIWREKSRSDKRGDIERNSTLAFSRWCVDSGNSPTKRPVQEHRSQVFAKQGG
uniref:Uncharacterized protein n=1 Tax=Proteus mirabilis TaxID=584 RepID=A0A7L4ZDC6_PROMI|nr:hypothetical protein [Proteus mirabilis]